MPTNNRVKHAILHLAHCLGEPFDNERMSGYEAALGHLGEAAVVGACRLAMQRARYMPRPAELLEMAREFKAANNREPRFAAPPPDNVMAMNAAVWPRFVSWLNVLGDGPKSEAATAARDDFLWSLQAQAKLHNVTIPWDDFGLYGIMLPWECQEPTRGL